MAREETVSEREIFIGYIGQESVTVVVSTGCASCIGAPGPEASTVPRSMLGLFRFGRDTDE
jgi:hypothetical protein